MGGELLRFAKVTAASAAALLLVEACRTSASEAVIGAGAVVDAGAVVLGDAAASLRDAGATIVDAGERMRDSGAVVVAQDSPNKSGSRIEVRQPAWSGADGSSFSLTPTLYDSKTGEPCVIGPAADRKQRCLPIGAGYVAPNYFADAECKAKVVLFLPGTACQGAQSSKYARSNDASACGNGPAHVHEIGNVRLTTVFQGGGTSPCVAVAVPSGQEARTIGAEISADFFVEFTAP